MLSNGMAVYLEEENSLAKIIQEESGIKIIKRMP